MNRFDAGDDGYAGRFGGYGNGGGLLEPETADKLAAFRQAFHAAL